MIHHQSGALFGLDARIALAVFSVIAIVASAAMVMNTDETKAKALAAELTDTTRAIESFHNDLKLDVFQVLDKPSEANAFSALFDSSVITEEGNLRGRWNGPYIKFTSTTHGKYGEMLLQKHAATHTANCTGEETCYLWLIYSQVKPSIVTQLNEVLDGTESAPATTGRVQWSADKDESLILHFRIGNAVTPTME